MAEVEFTREDEVAAGTAGITDTAARAEAVSRDINPDVAIGNLVESERQQATGETNALDSVVGSSDAVKAEEKVIESDVAGVQPPEGGVSAATEASRQFTIELDDQIKDLEMRRTNRLSQLEQSFNVAKDRQDRAQEKETGELRSGLFRAGAHLGVQGSALGVLGNLRQRHAAEISALEAKKFAAINEANEAIDDRQFELARDKAQEIKDLEQLIFDRTQAAFDNALKLTDEFRKAEKFQDEKLENEMSALGASGETFSDEFFAAVDTANGKQPGYSKGVFNLGVLDTQLAAATTEVAVAQAEFALANAVINFTDGVALGTGVEVNGITYYGTKGAGVIEVNEETGDASIFTVDADGNVIQETIGNVGSSRDGWSLEFVGDEPFRFNRISGEWRSFLGPKVDLNALVPPGRYTSTNFKDAQGNFLPFQCGELVNDMTGSTVGSTLQEKVDKMSEKGIEDAQVGDTIVIGGTSTGHVAIINHIYEDPDGNMKFVVSEANKDGQGTVQHDGEYAIDDKSIRGFIDTEFLPEYATGSDAARLEAAIVREGAGDAALDVTTLPNADLESIASNMIRVSKNKRQAETFVPGIQREWDRTVASNDPKFIREEIANQVLSTKFAEDRRSYTARKGTVANLEQGISIMNEMIKSGSNIGLLEGTWEELHNALGLTSDPNLKRLATFLKPTLFAFRKSVTGVQFSEYEAKDYNRLFPSTKQTPELFVANVEGLITSMKSLDESDLRTAIGSSNYDAYFVANPLEAELGFEGVEDNEFTLEDGTVLTW